MCGGLGCLIGDLGQDRGVDVGGQRVARMASMSWTMRTSVWAVRTGRPAQPRRSRAATEVRASSAPGRGPRPTPGSAREARRHTDRPDAHVAVLGGAAEDGIRLGFWRPRRKHEWCHTAVVDQSRTPGRDRHGADGLGPVPLATVVAPLLTALAAFLFPVLPSESRMYGRPVVDGRVPVAAY